MVNKASAKRGIVRNEGKSLLRRSTTSKPSPDSLCPFKIILCLSPGSHWFIQGQSTACAVHNHLHPSSFESTPSTTRLTQPERTLLQCAQKYAHAGSVQNMMSDLTGCIYSKQQIYHIKNSVEEQSDNDTSKLMNYLRQQAELGYLRYKALFHEVTQSTLITVEQARKRKHQAAMETLTSHITDDDWTLAASLSNIDIQLHTSASLGAGISEAEIPFQLDNNDDKLVLGIFLSPLQAHLKVGQKILLAVAWAREDEIQMFEQYPEVLMFDVTMSTNNEARPEGIAASVDGNMQVFTPFRVFLPSQCGWVFDWVFGSAAPTLLGAQNLRRLQLLLTDGDSKMYNAFERHRHETSVVSTSVLFG